MTTRLVQAALAENQRRAVTLQAPSWIKGATAVETGSEGVLNVLGAPFYGHKDGRDAHSQFFSPRTNFLREYPPALPTVYYCHGSLAGNDSTPLGVATKRWTDDRGEWFEVSLDLSDPRQEALWKDASRGNLYASTGVVPASYRVDSKSGEILQWQIGELSLLEYNKEANRAPANFYAVAIPAAKSVIEGGSEDYLKKLAPGGKMNFAQVMARLDELVRSWDGAEPTAADLPIARCEECDKKEEAPKAAVTPIAKSEDPELVALRQEIETLRIQADAATDREWALSQVREGKMEPSEVPAIVSAIGRARRMDALAKSDPAQGMVADIQTLIKSRTPFIPVETQAAGLAGFDSAQTTAGANETVDPAYVERMKRLIPQKAGGQK